jgi:isoprenylcysteine carboxyl methyltransferase (ICMT) family protein YpbQ
MILLCYAKIKACIYRIIIYYYVCEIRSVILKEESSFTSVAGITLLFFIIYLNFRIVDLIGNRFTMQFFLLFYYC